MRLALAVMIGVVTTGMALAEVPDVNDLRRVPQYPDPVPGASLTLGATASATAEAAARFGVASLLQIEDPKLEGIPPDAAVEALAQFCAQASPQVLLLNQSAEARTIAPRLAGRLGSAVLMNAVDISSDAGVLSVTAAAYGGDTRVRYELGV